VEVKKGSGLSDNMYVSGRRRLLAVLAVKVRGGRLQYAYRACCSSGVIAIEFVVAASLKKS